MCIQCEIEDAMVDLHARDFLMATLDGEILSTGQLESLLGTPTLDRVMLSMTERGKIAAENGALDF